jgi:phospholipase/carboxylesterase
VRGGTTVTFGSILNLPQTGQIMPSSDLSWRTFRPAEGFYSSAVESLDALPVRTFLPTAYEPRYPYPLVVFLHGLGGNEEQILRLAPRLSRRNFVCIGLRGPHRVGARDDGRPGCSWGPEGTVDALIEDYVLQAVEQSRRQYHIHSERIYLAGICEGAMLAYHLGLLFPEKFAGVISLNGTMPRHGRPLLRYPEIRDLRVFIGHGIANAVLPMSLALNDCKLLYTAGLSVEMHTYPSTHRLHPDMLRDINRWIIRRCNEEL